MRTRFFSPVGPAMLPAVLLVGGCVGYSAGGPGQSIDQYTYESIPDYPQTVTLVNTTTGETLWTMDVPVGQKLVMKFVQDREQPDPANPEILQWDLFPLSKGGFPELDNAMPVPPAPQRRVDVSYRPTGNVTPPPR